MTVEWPEHLIYALEMMSYPRPSSEQMVEYLLTHWGGLEMEVFLRMLGQEEAEYTTFALFALGYAPSPDMSEVFLPYLSREDPILQWASALGLGKLKDERALPVLTHMLQAFFSHEERAVLDEKDLWRHEVWRLETLGVLRDFNRPALVPVLRRALQKVVMLEERELIPRARLQVWKILKRELVYSLGRLQALGALTGIPVEEKEFGDWLIHLVMGSLHTRYPNVKIVKWHQNLDLYREIQEKLEQLFGLDEETREKYLSWYQKNELIKNY